jgi:phospholipase D1/2
MRAARRLDRNRRETVGHSLVVGQRLNWNDETIVLNSILKIGSNCWDISDAKETGLLIDGRDYYLAFYRAASKAEHYILISGWQFDSDVSLVRGQDVPEGNDVGLLSFLNGLCEKNNDLRIYLLGWNFNAIYGIDREWFQKWYFNWTTNDRLEFCFDACHCLGASHHQKFAVVDGAVAFLGGLDLCSSRWDDRDHCADNCNRINTG